jgi:hypothetical protein
MNILGREFITEQMPEGWVICERGLDGVLDIIDNQLSNRQHAQIKLQYFNDCLVKDCQKLGKSPEQYWLDHNDRIPSQVIHTK